MHYVRTASGSMMAVRHKPNTQTVTKKQTLGAKSAKRSKKAITSGAK